MRFAGIPMLGLLLGLTPSQDVAQKSADGWDAVTTPSMNEAQQKNLAEIANDISQLAHYRSANAALAAKKPGEVRVVFFGDSLTEGWGMARNGSVFFSGKGYLNRGISGQATLQMLGRFQQDVIDLHPDVLLLLAGTNDVAGNMGPASMKSITDNLQLMVDVALAHGVRVVLCSELPAAAYRWRPDIKPAATLAALNVWLKAYAQREGLVWVDYYSVLNNGAGGTKPEYTWDGVHPNKLGYERMAPLAEEGIARALGKK